MSNTPLTNWSGAYQTTTQGSNGLFSPLIVNDDGSIDINGTLITPNYDPDTATLSFDWTQIGNSTVKAQFTFSNQNGTIGFSGTIYPNQQSNGLGFSGTEITPLPLPSLANLALANGLFDTNDRTGIRASNGKGLIANFNPGNDHKVYATETGEFNLDLVIEKTADGQSIYLRNSGPAMYFRVGSDGFLYVDAQTAEEATPFNVYASMNGQALVATADGKYWTLNEDNSISLDSESTLGIAMEFSFDLSYVSPEELLSRRGIAMSESFSPCDLAWATLAWQLTGGIFLSFGLGPYIGNNRQIATGILGLLRSNATVWSQVQSLTMAVLTNSNQIKAVASATFAILGILYDYGLLWSVVKMVLKMLGWVIVFRIIGKIVELIFAPEAEAVELIASISTWALATIKAIKDVHDICYTSGTPSFQTATANN